ncbi:MAG: DPP IV N-terminal domain-containing protein [Chloroflexi bacterium]|nr:DPP IV N-terminal domain-containing protein [Chloroflexota bacterium]
MSNFKLFKFLCLTGLLALAISSSAACTGPATGYKPSGLPGSIAFASDRDKNIHIYTINPDGSDVLPTSDDNRTVDGLPRWSPDGSKMVFSSNQSGNYQIWSMSADGSDRKRLSDLKGRSALPRWSPDGSKIVFTSEVLNAAGDKDLEIFVMNSDGSGVQQLTVSPAVAAVGGAGHSENERMAWNSVPAWSPDSSKILFSSNRDGDAVTPILYIMNSDGSDQKKFGLFVTVDGSEPDWSPVTNKIVCVRGTAAKGDIWVMDASSPLPTLTARKITENIDDNRSPVWSPDGKQIAYVSDVNGNRDVYIMNADGAGVRRLTYGKSNNISPAWR